MKKKRKTMQEEYQEQVDKICDGIRGILTDKKLIKTECNIRNELISKSVSMFGIDEIYEFDLHIVYHKISKESEYKVNE